MSKQRAKGTRGENYFLEPIRRLFGPEIERTPPKGVNDWGDYVGVPWLHEAKHSVVPHFLEWARVAARKAATKGNARWVVMWKGDLRSAGNGPYVLMPLSFYEQLVRDHFLFRVQQPTAAGEELKRVDL